jgi:multicomponent Na+:H+ antiporter subunit F
MATLLATLLAGLLRVLLGPTDADRMMAAQLLGTTGVAILLVMSLAMGMPRIVDLALVFALLAAVSAICFVATGREADDDAD